MELGLKNLGYCYLGGDGDGVLFWKYPFFFILWVRFELNLLKLLSSNRRSDN